MKQGIVPALRFPEFSEAGEWKITTLNNLASRIIKKNNRHICRVLTNSAVDGIVDQKEYFDRDIVSEKNLHNYYVIENGDYVYNPRISASAPVGPISKNYIGQGVMSPLYTIFKFHNSNNEFYNHYFKTKYWHKYLKNVANQGARFDRMNITTDDFMNMPLPAPCQKEQQKIADCLSSIDALIKAAENKIDELKAHKKGLMQQLFPAKGKTVPALRFPEFQNAGEWSNSLLGKYIEEFQKKSFVQNEFEVLTSSREGLIRQREYYNNDRITERDNIGFNIIPPSYLTYRSRSDDRKFYFNENNLGITGIISTYYPVFRIIDGYGKFFIELFSYYAEIIGKYSDGTSQTVLSLNRLKSIKLPIPTKSEQQKIADCLSSVDDLITAQTNRLEALKAHKKGLMQQLFPNVNNNGESI